MLRLLLRTASTSYFAQKLSVLSLPEAGDRIRAAVAALWSTLRDVDSVSKLSQFRQLLSSVRDGLAGVDDETAYRYIEAQREGRMPLAQACFDFLPHRAMLDLAGWADQDIFAHV